MKREEKWLGFEPTKPQLQLQLRLQLQAEFSAGRRSCRLFGPCRLGIRAVQPKHVASLPTYIYSFRPDPGPRHCIVSEYPVV